MDFITLQKKIKELDLEVFTLNDLVKTTGQKKEVLKSTLTRLVKQKKLVRIKKNYYSLSQIQNKFKLQQVFHETYIALYSALEYYQSTTQRYNNLDLITNKLLKTQKVNQTTIKFHKVKNKFFFGFVKVNINNSQVFISNIEKTIIDCVYFSSKMYLTDINDFINKYKHEIDLELLTVYLKKINSGILNKRIGYLLELNGLEIKDLKFGNKYQKLNMNRKETKIKNSKWKLLINEEL